MKYLSTALAVFLGAATSLSVPYNASAHSPDDSAPADSVAESNKAAQEKIGDFARDHEYRAAIEAIEELEKRPGGQYDALVQRAWLATRYGDLRQAASILVPAMAKKRDTRVELRPELRPLLLGSLAYYSGDVDRGQELLREAADYFIGRPMRQVGETALMMQALDVLGQLHRERGEHRAAQQCIQQMRSTLGMVLPPGFNALADLHQAELYLAKGDVAQTEQVLKAAERLVDEDKSVPRLIRARVLTVRGLLATRRKDVREAEKALKEALTLREAVYHPFHHSIIQALHNLSSLYVVMAKSVEAVAYASKAADLADRRARHVLSMGSERQKRIAAKQLQHDTDAIVSLHLQYAPTNPTAARAALTTILRRKGMVFEAMLGGLNALRENLDDEGRALAKELTDLSSQMSTMISRGPIDITMQDFQDDLFDLEERRRVLEERLAAHAARNSKSRLDDQPLLKLEEVQQNIPDGAALVELFEYRPYRPFGPPVHPTWGKARIAAYVLHKTGDPAWVDLGTASPINSTAMKFVAELKSSGDHRPLARQLDTLVTEPLRKALGTTRWVLLSPDGALSFVPFYALVDESNRELVETMSITYMMTGRDLLRLKTDPNTPRQEALIVANPDFGKTVETEMAQVAMADTRAVDLSRVFFSQLQGTEEEGQRVQKTMGKSLLLAGSNATEEAIKAVHGPRVLHIATHGFFLPDIENAAASADGKRPRIDPWNANPLLRAGLALHGANRRRSETEREDGVLTALEVSNLDLQGTKLVVLSACETGVGQALSGEGVYGLQRAMMIAGAETQVTSLWQVDDEATKNLMVRFYEELAKGAGRSEAMRTAQLSVRQTKTHPFYWASFIVTGSGATLDGKTVAPDPRTMQVQRGARGCGCRTVESESPSGIWIAGLLATLGMLRRRRQN